MSKFRNNGFPSIFTYTVSVSKNVTKFNGWCYLKLDYRIIPLVLLMYLD